MEFYCRQREYSYQWQSSLRGYQAQADYVSFLPLAYIVMGKYLRHRLIVDADEFSRVRVDLEGAVETQCCVY